MAHHVLVQQYVVCVCVLCYAVAVLRDNRLTATDVTAQIRASTYGGERERERELKV